MKSKSEQRLFLIAGLAPVLTILLLALYGRQQYLGPALRFWAGSFSSSGTVLVTVGGAGATGPQGGDAILWDVAAGTGRLLLHQEAPFRAVACSPNGRLFALADFQGSVQVLDAVTAKPVTTLPPAGDLVNAVAFSADSKTIFSGSFDGHVRLWNVEERKGRDFEFPNERIVNIAVSSANSALLATTQAGKAFLVDLNGTNAPQELNLSEGSSQKANTAGLPEVQGHEAPTRQNAPPAASSVEAVSFSPDGNTFLVGYQGNVTLWKTDSRKWNRNLPGLGAKVISASFSPDGKTVAAVDSSGMLLLWVLDSNQKFRSTRAHNGISFSMAFSPDGTRIATVGRSDFTAKIWDSHTLALITTLRRKSAVSSPN